MTLDSRSVPREPKQERSQATRLKLLDAAVECLLDEGYANLTTAKVAARAGVSRGAQQHHFPHKAVLVAEAVDHLYSRQDRWILDQARKTGDGADRVVRVLDLLWTSYSGKLFAAAVELALAAEHDAELRPIVRKLQRDQDAGTVEWCRELFGPAIADGELFEQRVEVVLSMIRGLAMLLSFGYPRRAVNVQWTFARALLVELVTSGTVEGPAA